VHREQCLRTCNDDIAGHHWQLVDLCIICCVSVINVLRVCAKLQRAVEEVLLGRRAQHNLALAHNHEPTVTLHQQRHSTSRRSQSRRANRASQKKTIFQRCAPAQMSHCPSMAGMRFEMQGRLAQPRQHI
jgi:hypothetical protein